MARTTWLLALLLPSAIALSAGSAGAQTRPDHPGRERPSYDNARHVASSREVRERWAKEQDIRRANAARRERMRAGPTREQQARWAKESAERKYRAEKNQQLRNGNPHRRS
jgi:hypothetical protein